MGKLTKMNSTQSFLKMVIKILILMILVVCLFIISLFLYSARYWPDVYNYINANITIKRIPTISELDIQIVEVGYDDFTTEGYSTTDADYFELTTIDDFDVEEFMKGFDRRKRYVEIEDIKDYKELPNRPIFVDYIFLEEPIEIKSEDNDTNEDNYVLEKVVTGTIIKNETNSDTIFVTAKENSNKFDANHDDLINDMKGYLFEHTTTKEGYLVGEEIDNEEPTVLPIYITTEANEDDTDEIYKPILLKDLVDVTRLSTRGPEEVEMVAGTGNVGQQETIFVKTVFPWLATIYIKNGTDNAQFQYYCDGALLSEKVILTGARCMFSGNQSVAPENVLVFLGKGNLQSMSEAEKLVRIKNIIVHENFTTSVEGAAVNDLALLIMESPVVLDDRIQSACLYDSNSTTLEEAATTAWAITGQLTPIYFEKKSDICFDKDEDIFCATYGNDVALCPSYGGLYVAKRSSKWCLQGIFYGDPAYRGLCFNKNVLYTSLRNYLTWINEFIVINTNIL